MSISPNYPDLPTAPRADRSFIGGGEMGKVVRAKDWSQTPLGPIESWPSSLRTAVSLVLNSNFPISLAWGPDHIQIYNDGYWPICGDKHPTSMGQNFSECWASAFPAIGEAFRSALAGTTAFLEDQRMFLDRLGYLEETFFTFSFSPIRDEHGAVVGLFHPVTETTGKMLAQRRTRTLRDLTAIGLDAQSLDDALRRSAQTLAEAALDVPFVLFYRIDKDRRSARLVAQAGLAPGGAGGPEVVDLTREDAGWPLARVAASGMAAAVNDVRTRFPGLVCGPYPEPLTSARVQPIAPPGYEQALGLMVVGVSARLPMNEAYATFHDLLSATVGHVIASALAVEAERQRVGALAEIDRAKTAFFANISHEFRTPLTLMLGPLEDELAERAAPLPTQRRERIETAHRNSLRLLKLVNTLLDFSRIEAGRAHANYQATDLAAYTVALASTFRSVIKKAGLTLTVDCPALPEPVFVDREMWEKIVLNLLSNALKHTFAGGIRVALRWEGDQVELEVADSGVGIPAADLPRLFERFHRVKGARSRTHEGTGIGLALVQDLIRLHGGAMRVASEEGKGSTFSATLKTGRAHLPEEQVAATSAPLDPAKRAAAYVEEALQWIPAAAPVFPAASAGAALAAGVQRERIVWADDNADMRDYVRRLLGEHYDVTAVSNGAEAVAASLVAPPDLVLTDIMMPGLDGYGVLRELRANERTRHIPVVLLSARAGEEAVAGGLEVGADDYLVKPFAAGELLARVRMHLGLAKLRREWAAEQARTAELERDAAGTRKRLETAAQSRRALLSVLEDQRQADLALRAKSEELDRYFANSLDLLCIADTEGYFHRLNPEWQRTLGYPLAELEGRRFLDFVHPDDMEATLAALGKLSSREQVFNFANRYRHKDGSYRWIEWRSFAEGGRIYAVARDITERKLTEALLDGQKQVLELIAKNEPLTESLVKLVRVIEFQSPAMLCSILLLDADGVHVRHGAAPSLPEQFVRAVDGSPIGPRAGSCGAAAYRGEPVIVEDIETDPLWDDYRHIAAPHGLRACWSIPIFDTQHHVLGTFAMYFRQPGRPNAQHLRLIEIATQIAGIAISGKRREAEVLKLNAELEQRVLERTVELEAAKIRAEAADRMKSLFLATMSHELRTPLNSIIGFSGVLLQKLPGPLNAEQEKQLGIVLDASRHLLALINDVLDISKVEAGELSLARERFDLRALLERVSAAFAPQAERRGLALRLDVGENESVVMGDARRVEQVLNNLLSNALKFTPRGAITLTLAQNGGSFVIAVADTGVGIKPEDMDKLFRPFSQIESGLPELHEGTGLGLAISNHLVEAMGGQVVAESEWGKGSRFTFTLPAGGHA